MYVIVCGTQVTLSHKKHHVEYMHVSDVCSMDYTLSCKAAFDYKVNSRADIKPAKCKKVAKGTPYEAIRKLNSEIGQTSMVMPYR